VLADVAAADAFAAKGASDIDARQMQATLRSLVADAVKNSTAQTASSPPAKTQQAMLRYALARHGESQDLLISNKHKCAPYISNYSMSDGLNMHDNN